MSISTLEVIASRIAVATAKSKIAVFIVRKDGLIQLDVVFDTATTCAERKRFEPQNYVGSFYANQKQEALHTIRKALRAAKEKGFMG